MTGPPADPAPPAPAGTPDGPAPAAGGPPWQVMGALFAQSPLAVAVYDAGGRVAFGNAAYERHFGVRVADVPGDWSLRTDPQLAAAGITPLVRRAYAGEAVTLPATRYDAAVATGGPGRAVWTQGHAFPLHDAAGRVTHVAVVHVDVTGWAEAERRLHEQAAELGRRVREAEEAGARLRASEARFAAAQDVSLEGFLLLRPERDAAGALVDLVYTYVNRAGAEILRHPAEALVGRGLLTLFPGVREAGLWDAYRRVLETGEPFRREVLYEADGLATGFRLAVVRLGDGLAISYGDVTDRLRAERQTRELLEVATAERARAEEASRAKSQFLATMSHELRTPLNAIAGYAELLGMGIYGPVTEAQRDAVERVSGAQRRLLALVNDVLGYARLESGRVEYAMRAVDLAGVVAEAAVLVEPQLRARGVTFEARVAPAARGGPPPVWADPDRLGQVLVNLLGNAAKFTPPGGRVTVDAAVRPGARRGGGARVVLRVCDTGPGVPSDKREAVFEPFVQLGAGYAGAVAGAGLGLAISRDLTRGMGGELTAGEAPGGGAAFAVALRPAPAR